MKQINLRWVLIVLVALAGLYIFIDHQEHLIKYLPFSFLLGCLLMHVFMHKGHNH